MSKRHDVPAKDMQRAVSDTAEEDRTTDSVEALARRIVSATWDHTNGMPMRWVLLSTIEERLALLDEASTEAAVQFAVEKLWLERFSGSLRLTNSGRTAESFTPEAFSPAPGSPPR